MLHNVLGQPLVKLTPDALIEGIPIRWHKIGFRKLDHPLGHVTRHLNAEWRLDDVPQEHETAHCALQLTEGRHEHGSAVQQHFILHLLVVPVLELPIDGERLGGQLVHLRWQAVCQPHHGVPRRCVDHEVGQGLTHAPVAIAQHHGDEALQQTISGQ